LNYSFKDRYLVEVNGRYDGSSKFPEDQRYGFFPSVSAGWRVSKEKFWNVSPKFISDLKIRGSYGSLGNGNIASYAFRDQFNIAQLGIILNGIRPHSLPAALPFKSYVETRQQQYWDLAMLSNRLHFVGDAYIRETSEIRPCFKPPAVFGATAPGKLLILKQKAGN
jgi:hypothetical protein